jgi:hypothetical protein
MIETRGVAAAMLSAAAPSLQRAPAICFTSRSPHLNEMSPARLQRLVL